MTLHSLKENLLRNSGVLFIFFLYAVISIFLLYITSGGWTGLIYIMLGVPFYTGFLLILFILAFFRPLMPPQNLIQTTLTIQGILLVLNFGDCGDNGYKGLNFFQYFLGTSCLGDVKPNPVIDFEIILVLLMIYVLSLFFLFFHKGIIILIKNLHPKKFVKSVINFWKYGRMKQ